MTTKTNKHKPKRLNLPSRPGDEPDCIAIDRQLGIGYGNPLDTNDLTRALDRSRWASRDDVLEYVVRRIIDEGYHASDEDVQIYQTAKEMVEFGQAQDIQTAYSLLEDERSLDEVVTEPSTVYEILMGYDIGHALPPLGLDALDDPSLAHVDENPLSDVLTELEAFNFRFRDPQTVYDAVPEGLPYEVIVDPNVPEMMIAISPAEVRAERFTSDVYGEEN